MTPTAIALVLLLTFLAVTIINWLIGQPSSPDHMRLRVAIVLILAFLWVIGTPRLDVRVDRSPAPRGTT